MRWRWAAAGLLLALVLAGGVLSYRASTENRYSDVDELVAELRDSGIECKGLTVSAPAQSEEVGGEFGFCSVDDRTVNIHVYYESDRVTEHVESNVAVRGDDPNYFTSLVHGTNWVVDSYSEETSQRVQEAIGGEII